MGCVSIAGEVTKVWKKALMSGQVKCSQES